MPHISESQFTERFVTMATAGRDLPKRPLDLHILLISASLGLDPDRTYSEPEVNEELSKWSARFGGDLGMDHVTLRRLLVDERYLSRDPAGVAYRLQTAERPYTFDPSIRTLDLEGLIDEERRARAERKRLHSERKIGE